MLTHLVLRYIKWKDKVVSSYTRFAAIIRPHSTPSMGPLLPPTKNLVLHHSYSTNGVSNCFPMTRIIPHKILIMGTENGNGF